MDFNLLRGGPFTPYKLVVALIVSAILLLLIYFGEQIRKKNDKV